MQTILGSGGAIGTTLAKELAQYTSSIRLVSRNPVKVNDSDLLFSADLTLKKDIDTAVSGSDVVYVTVGFPYHLKTWQTLWPPFIENVINACKMHNAKLVFFDNIYMYDANHLNGMTEETPINPPSKKGAIRAQIAQRILDEIAAGELTAIIARSADFYGPGIEKTSMFTEMVLAPLSKNKKANWMASVDFKHSFTYTLDAGKATALLGNTDDAYNQVWHLPTAKNPPTGKEWIESAAMLLSKKASYQIANSFLVKVLGLFIPVMREMPEMMYQYNRDYVFDSSKFEARFGLHPTPYKEGLKEIVETDYL